MYPKEARDINKKGNDDSPFVDTSHPKVMFSDYFEKDQDLAKSEQEIVEIEYLEEVSPPMSKFKSREEVFDKIPSPIPEEVKDAVVESKPKRIQGKDRRARFFKAASFEHEKAKREISAPRAKDMKMSTFKKKPKGNLDSNDFTMNGQPDIGRTSAFKNSSSK